MFLPPVPDNEAERLAELKKYSILDTLPEKDLDDLTQLASEICQTPMALIGLIDEHRQWYKAKVGVTANEVNRETSFCSYTLCNPGEILEVPDSRLDDRFKDNPNVTGEPHVIFYAGAPLTTSGGFVLGTLCVIDMKPKKLNEEQLNALRIIANQIINMFELRRSVAALKDAEARLKESNEEIRAFTYSVSHDLRSPLRSINSYASILLDEYTNQLGEEAGNMCQRIGSEARRLGDLIDDLLTYSQLNQSVLAMNVIDMYRLAADAFKRIVSMPGQKPVQYIIYPLPKAKGDTAMLTLVWQNLIDNAVKFSSKKEGPFIEIGSKKENGVDIYYIRDNGAGFDMKYVHKLFGVFERLCGLNEFEGTGVGLAIIRRIIERHGGRIWAEGVLNEGATFYFTLG